MLVISRKPGQSIYIGEEVMVRVIDSRPGRVRIGIEAPREVSIRREELRPPTPPLLLSVSRPVAALVDPENPVDLR